MSDNPSPALILSTINAYRDSATLRGGIDLDVFTAIGEGHDTIAQLAQLSDASERGMRILCDCLTTLGFVTKRDNSYALTADSAAFLDRRSPAYMGDAAYFLMGPLFTKDIGDVAAAVRKGGVVSSPRGSDEPDHPEWVEFARAMTGMQSLPAQVLAGLVDVKADGICRVLDVAAGSGVFGITLAKQYPNVEVTALDWPRVLEVTRENAIKANVAERVTSLAGDAFTLELDDNYDVIVIVNFFHHFEPSVCESFMRRLGDALAPHGKMYTLDWVPNPDRVSPPEAAMFAMQMLRQTPSGDAYTGAEYEAMFTAAGLPNVAIQPLEPTPYTLIVAGR